MYFSYEVYFHLNTLITFLTNAFYSREFFELWTQYSLASWVPWVIAKHDIWSTQILVLIHSWKQSFILLNYQSFLPFSHCSWHSTFKEVCFLSCFLLFWYGLWTLAECNKDAVQKAASVVMGSWQQQQYVDLFYKANTYPYYREQYSIQNAAVVFLQCSDKHQHNNSKLHIKNWFLGVLLKCTSTHIDTQKKESMF